ncbi:hypothetical protein DICPUDRAFT_78547 [Dictyostelium purpureum]|uniref:FNIP repeat-containing protein n=1 Tax=Dictyostelium purpureum TaxID=5786 RepID=F0ZJV9_DICPU|nr:uncharacterized protein DICPUDRAFT_78547 [Dictyostelium purpureum]EGC35762.1 hypothetical protein DICPUDRAFT_78547 [Dictyostelium purpureum]|eukprot:XP_003287714.1 hypothetical protein DICPUDRAFT_78547 [Dictyostelium purpureum]
MFIKVNLNFNIDNNGEFINNDVLFKKVWGNKYIRNIILGFFKEQTTKENISQFIVCKYIDLPIQPNFENIKLKICHLNTSDIIIAESIKRLVLDTNATLSFRNLIIPQSLTYLNFGQAYRKFVDVPLKHTNIKTLVFSDAFNQELNENLVPSNLTSLIFGDKFNMVIPSSVLPSSLKLLIFGKYFNKPIIPHSLPDSLKTLQFGDCYNKMFLPGSLPSSITDLTLGKNFKLPLYYQENNGIIHANLNLLPPLLKYITVGKSCRLKDILSNYTNHISLLKLNITRPIRCDTLTSLNVSEIIFGPGFDKEILPNTLPNTLTSITFSPGFDKQILPNTLPNTLTSITFGPGFDKEILPNTLPNTLTSITFGTMYIKFDKENAIPNSVTTLIFKPTLEEFPYYHIYMQATPSEDFIIYEYKLPSITSITLPKYFQSYIRFGRNKFLKDTGNNWILNATVVDGIVYSTYKKKQ